MNIHPPHFFLNEYVTQTSEIFFTYIKTLLRIFLNTIQVKVYKKSWAIQHTVSVLFYRFVTLILTASSYVIFFS